MSILGLDSFGAGELVACIIVAVFAFNERIEAGLRALWRRIEG